MNTELSLDDIQRLSRGTVIADATGAHWTVGKAVVNNRILLDSEGNAFTAREVLSKHAPLTRLPIVDDIPDQAARDLATRLMLQSAQDNLSATTSLMETYRRRAERAEAALRIIRGRIEELCDGPFVPNPAHVYRALWPSDAEINELAGDG